MICFFDTETNGLNPRRFSLLSICMIIAEPIIKNGKLKLKELSRLIRYYYPIESYNGKAIAVNGLTAEVLKEKRNGANYPKNFIEDHVDITNFAIKANRFVGHNVNFDKRFVPFDTSPSYCTMQKLTRYCSIPHSYYGIKWPRLEEAVEILKADISDLESDYHDALFDVYSTMRVFKKAYSIDELKYDIEEFLNS